MNGTWLDSGGSDISLASLLLLLLLLPPPLMLSGMHGQ